MRSLCYLVAQGAHIKLIHYLAGDYKCRFFELKSKFHKKSGNYLRCAFEIAFRAILKSNPLRAANS